jgi:hypothetical protein
MPDRALHRGMDFVERTFQDLADEYLLTIAESHWVLDESSQQLPQRFCFYVQGHGEPYCLEFPARQLAAVAQAQAVAERRTVAQMIRDTVHALTHA